MYVVTTLFGAETPNSLLNPPLLQSAVELICELVTWYSKPVKYAAYVAGPKAENVGTGGKKLVPGKLLAELQTYMTAGHLHDLRCFEADAGAQKRDPEFFLQVHKKWRYDDELGYMPSNTGGIGIVVTLAIHDNLLARQEDAAFWLSRGTQLFSLAQGTAGWVEVASPWGRSKPGSRLQDYLIEYRYRDIPSLHYRFGSADGTELDMCSQLALLEWGNFLGPQHLERLGERRHALERLRRALHVKEIDGDRILVSASSAMQPINDEDREALRRVLQPLLPE